MSIIMGVLKPCWIYWACLTLSGEIRYPVDAPQIYSALSHLGARLSTLVEEVWTKYCLDKYFAMPVNWPIGCNPCLSKSRYSIIFNQVSSKTKLEISCLFHMITAKGTHDQKQRLDMNGFSAASHSGPKPRCFWNHFGMSRSQGSC